MKVYAFALAMLCCAIPAGADTIQIEAHGHYEDFVFGPSGNFITDLGTVETVSTSFQYNTTLQEIVPGSVTSFSATGLLGFFSFVGINQVPSGVLNFDWSSALANLRLDLPVIPTATFPNPGYGTKDLLISCTTEECNDDFGGRLILDDQESALSAQFLTEDVPSTPTPEPSPLVLVGFGLIGVPFISKLRLIASSR
jgi:hypothetical protein